MLLKDTHLDQINPILCLTRYTLELYRHCRCASVFCYSVQLSLIFIQFALDLSTAYLLIRLLTPLFPPFLIYLSLCVFSHRYSYVCVGGGPQHMFYSFLQSCSASGQTRTSERKTILTPLLLHEKIGRLFAINTRPLFPVGLIASPTGDPKKKKRCFHEQPRDRFPEDKRL